jgi:hypothetical protein
MSIENKEFDKKKRGGQPGNRNARTHGFYSRELTTEQHATLQAADSVNHLDEEIALLRLKILAIANSPTENYPALLMAMSLLVKMITVNREFERVDAMVDSFHDEFVAKQAADKRAQQFDRRMMLNSPELLDITE